MEVNFLLLVAAALAGLVVNTICKFNPWAIFGTFSFLILLFPILGLGFQHDPQVVQSMTNAYIERLVNALPSLIVGEVAGMIAAGIFNTVTERS